MENNPNNANIACLVKIVIFVYHPSQEFNSINTETSPKPVKYLCHLTLGLFFSVTRDPCLTFMVSEGLVTCKNYFFKLAVGIVNR